MTRQASGPPVLTGVQSLRGMAALAVVATHVGRLWTEQYGSGAPAVLAQGLAGVDVFFVISGVVMALSASGSRTVSAGTFLRRRFLRVAPLYWLVTLVAVAKVSMVDRFPTLATRASHLAISALDVVRSLCFIPYRDSAGTLFPVLQVGWTLNFEIFFYLLFAVALLVRVRPVRLLAPLLVGLAVVGGFVGSSPPAWTSLLSPLLLEFLAGMLVVAMVRRCGGRLRRLPWLWGGMMLVGAGALATLTPGPLPWSRALDWGIPATLVVGGAVLLDPWLAGRVPRALLLLGDASYSLYLSHLLVLMATFRLGRAILSGATVLRLGFWPMALPTLGAAVVVGLALYRWVERPMTVALAHWTGWNRGRAPMPVN